MHPSRKAVALATSLMSALSAFAIAQTPPARPSAAPPTIVVDDATVDWIEKSEVSALRPGVIERMELQIGMPVRRGGPIGYLHSEVADLTVKKAAVAAESVGPQKRAKAQRDLAVAVVARNKRLIARDPNYVSKEEQSKAEAEVNVAEAMMIEAEEKVSLDKADLDLAKRALEEHTIRAPFDGVVIHRTKNPGEAVQANEAVVTLGNLDRLRVWTWVPLQFLYRIKEGAVVEIQPSLDRINGGSPLPIENKKFRGKITFVDPQILPEVDTAVRIYAEFDNQNHELLPGMKAKMTIYLTPDAPAAAPAPTVGARSSLPALPR
jgi:RND family efflux transporter MFP subunit